MVLLLLPLMSLSKTVADFEIIVIDLSIIYGFIVFAMKYPI